MGQEPWLNYVMSVKYTPESNPIMQSNQLIRTAEAKASSQNASSEKRKSYSPSGNYRPSKHGNKWNNSAILQPEQRQKLLVDWNDTGYGLSAPFLHPSAFRTAGGAASAGHSSAISGSEHDV